MWGFINPREELEMYLADLRRKQERLESVGEIEKVKRDRAKRLRKTRETERGKQREKSER